jgi:serine/threonine protein kinase
MALPRFDPTRWALISPQLDRVLDVEGRERAALLDDIAATDPALAADLRALLAQHESLSGSTFLETESVTPNLDVDALTATLADLQIGAYTLRSLIGQGGMGSVWLAERTDGQFAGVAALKLLNLSLVGKASAARFRREGAILARLSHPSIARLLDAGVSSTGQPYLVLEHVDGSHIDAYCRQHGLDESARVSLFMQVLAGVAQAHAQLVIHRDIKPSNLMVSKDGHAKLLDFGIAAFLEPVTVSGADSSTPPPDELTRVAGHAHTLNYASPEQLRRDRVGAASDIYSLGAVLHNLLSERSPYRVDKGGAAEREAAILAGDVLPLAHSSNLTRFKISRDLASITKKAMALSAADRYDSVSSFRDDLQRFLEGNPVRARGRARAYLLRNFAKRHWLSLSVVAAAFAAISVAALMIWWESETLRRTKAFLIEALTPTSYYTDGGGLLTQRELLMRAANGIPQRFADQPKAAGELYQAIGESLFNMGEQADALDVRQRGQPLLDAVHGPRSVPAIRNASRVTYLFFTLRRTPEFLAGMTDLRDRCEYSEAALPALHCYSIERMQSQHRSQIGQSRISSARWEAVDARVSSQLKSTDPWHELVNYWGSLAATNVSEVNRSKAHWARLLVLPTVAGRGRGEHQYALAASRLLNEAGFYDEAATLARTVYQQGVAYLGTGFDARLFYAPGVAQSQAAAGVASSVFDIEDVLRRGIAATDTRATPEARQESAESRAALGVLLVGSGRADEAVGFLRDALALQRERVSVTNGEPVYSENVMRLQLQLAAVAALTHAAEAERSLVQLRDECERAADVSCLMRADALLGVISASGIERDAAWSRATNAMQRTGARLPDVRVMFRAMATAGVGTARDIPAPVEDATVTLMRNYVQRVLAETAREIAERAALTTTPAR